MNSLRFVMMAFVGVGLLLDHALPYLHAQRLFGLAVPPEMRYGSAGAEIVRRYELRLLPWTILSLLAALLVPMGNWPVLPVLVAAAISGIATSRCYALAYAAVLPFSAPETGIRQAPLSDPGGDFRRVAWRFGPPLAILIATALYLRARWDQIPPRFAIHFTLQGVPNGWAEKTVSGIFGPLLLGTLSVLFVAGLSLAILLGARRGTPVSPALSVMTAIAYLVASIFSMVAMLALHYLPPWAVLGVIAGYFVVLGVVIVRALSAPAGEDITPSECWHGGQFYYNPSDPALFVQTKVGSSYTLNFGNRASWYLAGGIVLYIAGMVGLARTMWS